MESYKHWIVNGDKNGNELFNQLPFNVKNNRKHTNKNYRQKFRKLLSAVTNLKTSTREKYTAHLNAFQKEKKTWLIKNNRFQTNTFAI